MAWRTFLVKKFTALAKLIEKVGKAPKDRLLRKVRGRCFVEKQNTLVVCCIDA